MSAIITNGQLILGADGVGYSHAVRTLPAAPAQADMMVLYFQNWFDAFPGNAGGFAFDVEFTTPGWDARGCFGLSFSGVPPKGASLANFFGWVGPSASFVNYRCPGGISDGTNSSTSGYVSDASHNQPTFYKGDTTGVAISGLSVNASSIPINPVDGAKFTGIWIIRKNLLTQQIVVSIGYNLESLSLANIGNARTSTKTQWVLTNSVITESTNWRPNTTDIIFPGFLIMKHCAATTGHDMKLSHFKIEYYNFNSQTLLG